MNLTNKSNVYYEALTKDTYCRDFTWSGSLGRLPEGVMRAELWNKTRSGRRERVSRRSGLKTVFLTGSTACAKALW